MSLFSIVFLSMWISYCTYHSTAWFFIIFFLAFIHVEHWAKICLLYAITPYKYPVIYISILLLIYTEFYFESFIVASNTTMHSSILFLCSSMYVSFEFSKYLVSLEITFWCIEVTEVIKFINNLFYDCFVADFKSIF